MRLVIVCKVTIMAVEYLQAKINYWFVDCELLRSALKLAHRNIS
jgi:hypothetical protein